MTEQNPQPDPDAPQGPTTDPAPTPTVKADDLTGHMVYDLTLKRFVGRKADSKSAANKTVKRVKGHEYETRAV